MRVQRGHSDQLTTEVAALLATFPGDAELSREQWKALVAMEKHLAGSLKDSGAACKHFGGVQEERGGLNRRECSEFDAALTRGLDAFAAFTALGTWINTHHIVLSAAVAQRNGVEWPKLDIDLFLEGSAELRRLRRTLR